MLTPEKHIRLWSFQRFVSYSAFLHLIKTWMKLGNCRPSSSAYMATVCLTDELPTSMLLLLIFLECSLVGAKLEIIPQIFRMNFTENLKVDSKSSLAITACSTTVPRLMHFYSHQAFIMQLHPYRSCRSQLHAVLWPNESLKKKMQCSS